MTYTDDDFDSYSVIFDSAKTDITDADRTRLIAALKTLGECTDITSAVDTDAVIRYFAVHNFVVNFDSYTGSMIHNYYLYEEDGVLTMLPWDYNLAFGGFMSSSDAESLVNYPIDTPVSGSSVEDRPMLAWIFASEEYTDLYHEVLDTFIAACFASGWFTEMLDSAKALITPYVEKDPTKFCTAEEFEAGFAVLREFCLLRAESVRGQLDGKVPSTSAGQAKDKSNFVKADGLSLSAMGSMGGDRGGKGGFDRGDRGNAQSGGATLPTGAPTPQRGDALAGVTGSTTDASGEVPDTLTTPETPTGNTRPTKPGNMADGGITPGQQPAADAGGRRPSGNFPISVGQQQKGEQSAETDLQNGETGQKDRFANQGDRMNFPTGGAEISSQSDLLLLGITGAVLLFGLLFAGLYKRRR
ncbi:MAG: CotH kinase family protein [Clostridia bacterium]|nr:CotH kinase family protein [Clostridia bacterium]